MAVLAEALTVVVRRTTLEARYPGGVAQYELDCPNATYAMDEHLTRVGFMSPADVGHFARHLEHHGLIFHGGTQSIDIAVVDQFMGSTGPCAWLSGGRHATGFSAVWLKGTDPGAVAFYASWKPEYATSMRWTPSEELANRFLAVGQSGPSLAFLDFETGKEVYVGSPALEEDLRRRELIV